jgi:hypothetical protein
MEDKKDLNIPEEVQNFYKRVQLFHTGSQFLGSFKNYFYDYKSCIFQIKFLASTDKWSRPILLFLKDDALPSILLAIENLDNIIGGITKKNRYVNGHLSLPSFLNGDNLLKYDPVSQKERAQIREDLRIELDYYVSNLNEIISSSEINNSTSNPKIKTDLSVEELAGFFKILNEYDDRSPKKILKDYPTKRDLHYAVISSFSSAQAQDISLNSYETKYNSTDITAALDFWIQKFKTLNILASILQNDLLNKPDKAIKKRIKKG